ncbi:MAG: hypothetical protein ACFB9M_18545 [Myxococcota bacterium]
MTNRDDHFVRALEDRNAMDHVDPADRSTVRAAPTIQALWKEMQKEETPREPPLGFTTRVLARARTGASSRPRWWFWSSLFSGLAVVMITVTFQRPENPPPAAVHADRDRLPATTAGDDSEEAEGVAGLASKRAPTLEEVEGRTSPALDRSGPSAPADREKEAAAPQLRPREPVRRDPVPHGVGTLGSGASAPKSSSLRAARSSQRPWSSRTERVLQRVDQLNPAEPDAALSVLDEGLRQAEFPSDRVELLLRKAAILQEQGRISEALDVVELASTATSALHPHQRSRVQARLRQLRERADTR